MLVALMQIWFVREWRSAQQQRPLLGGVYTTNRRFKKMRPLRVGWLFLKTAVNYWNQRYFPRDHNYWAEPDSLPRA